MATNQFRIHEEIVWKGGQSVNYRLLCEAGGRQIRVESEVHHVRG